MRGECGVKGAEWASERLGPQKEHGASHKQLEERHGMTQAWRFQKRVTTGCASGHWWDRTENTYRCCSGCP